MSVVRSPRGAREKITGIALLALALAATPARADLAIGGDARAVSMGGAGLALRHDDASGFARVNPASLAYVRGAFGFYVPAVSLRADGAVSSLSRAADYLSDSEGGGEGAAADLAREYAIGDSSLGLSSGLGLRLGHVEVTATAAARARLTPNAVLREWAQGADSGSEIVPPGSRADVIGGGYYTLPSVAFATTVPNPNAGASHSLAVGARVSVMRGFYSHYFADASVLNSEDADALRAPEMGDADYLEKTGVGIDVGLLFRPRGEEADRRGGWSAALVANNLVKPDFRFRGTDAQGNPRDYDLLATTVSAGAAYERGDLAFAADLVDVGGAAGEGTQLRLGAEQRLGRLFAVRAGYNSGFGFSVGGRLFGLDVAYGDRMPLQVAQTFRF